MNWSIRRNKCQMTIASLLEHMEIDQLDGSNDEIWSNPNLSFEHCHPSIKTMFFPKKGVPET
jgi:hypothetical protein